jgi:hypothetical protein
MQFVKANQKCRSFLDFFYCSTFFKKRLQTFLGVPVFILNIKAWSNKAIHIKRIGAKRQVSGMDSELKSSHSFVKTT